MFLLNRIRLLLAVTFLLTGTLAGVVQLPADARDSQPDSYTSKSIALLEQSFAARKQMVLLEQQIEDAPNDAIVELENKLDSAEMQHQQAEFQLELLTSARELSNLETEVEEEGLREFLKDVHALLRSHEKLRTRGNQYFETWRNSPSENERPVEELESSFVAFEKERTLLELRIGLFHSEEEGNEALSEELRQEIRSLEE